jgi:carbamoyltransferase
MVILGLNAFGQNPSACLAVDGKLRAFSHEERFNRLKGSHGLFPSQATSWCLASQGLNIGEVDKIAINWDCHKYPFTALRNLASVALKGTLGRKLDRRVGSAGDGMGGVINYLNLYRPANYQSMIYAALRESGFRGHLPELVYVNHHLSHAYQAYYQSGFDDALVLVADGHGEDTCVSGYAVRGGKFSKILHYPVPYSLGWFYGGFTAYLGFHANRDEGKLMGLAAYGEEGKADNPWLQRLDRILKVNGDGFDLDPYFFKLGGNYHHSRYTDALVKFITGYDPTLRPVGVGEKAQFGGQETNRYLLPQYIDLAYAVQTRLEDALLAVVKNMLSQTSFNRICLAGGVFMNCKANHAIAQLPEIEDAFIHPAASDDGSAIGAAYWVSRQLGADTWDPLRHVQYGAAFSNEAVQKALDVCGVEYHALEDTAATTAKLLAQGKIIGWFQGGAEMGARALGGRSIIACPDRTAVKQVVNSRIKFRESWRPYCPSLPRENQKEYLQGSIPLPFMIRAEKATELLARQAPATVHVDNTVRPQTVDKGVLPLWHHLICETGKLTGVPVLLNTSFNVRGEPMVNSPFDAIRTFFSTGLDALVIGDFLVLKKGCRID